MTDTNKPANPKHAKLITTRVRGTGKALNLVGKSPGLIKSACTFSSD